MPDLSRVFLITLFLPSLLTFFHVFRGVSLRLVHCAGHPTLSFLFLLLLLSPHLVDIFHLAEESNFPARLLVH